jgi:hypothetical protein
VDRKRSAEAIDASYAILLSRARARLQPGSQTVEASPTLGMQSVDWGIRGSLVGFQSTLTIIRSSPSESPQSSFRDQVPSEGEHPSGHMIISAYSRDARGHVPTETDHGSDGVARHGRRDMAGDDQGESASEHRSESSDEDVDSSGSMYAWAGAPSPDDITLDLKLDPAMAKQIRCALQRLLIGFLARFLLRGLDVWVPLQIPCTHFSLCVCAFTCIYVLCSVHVSCIGDFLIITCML